MPVNCPHGDSGATGRRGRRSSLGYRTFACHACRRIFNERSGTPFNELQYPTDLVLLAVLWRLRDKLSFRDVAELLLPRGFEVTPRDDPCVGVSLRTPAGRPTPPQTSREGRRLVVPRRDVREDRWVLVLPLSSHRRGR